MKHFRHYVVIACASAAFLAAHAEVDPFMTTDQRILDQGSPDRLIRKQTTFPAEYDLSFGGPAPTNWASRLHSDGSVELNFEDAPLFQFISVYARLQGLEAQVNGILTNRITLKTREPRPLNEALDLMEKAIKTYGIELSVDGKSLTVREQEP